jgi:hypothetical protein
MRALYNIRGLVLALLVGVIIGFGIGVLISNDMEISLPVKEQEEESQSKESTQKDVDKTPASIAPGDNSFVINSQSAQNHVIASMIALSTNGWVAVHEVLEGEPSPIILGAKRFDAGKYFGERIDLLRPTEAETYYMLVLHFDDGDSEFDFKGAETPLLGEGGAFIAEEFFVTPNVSE